MKENEWPAYTRDQPNYYILNAENNGMGKGPRTTACAFWNDFMPRLKGAPDPTPEACNSLVASSVSSGNTSTSSSMILSPAKSVLSTLLLLLLRSLHRDN
uniref:Acetylcholinesterase n=1 Tax=Trichogramma kaykai TaxID=54128 RepID=A0ABD2WE85_9HYME